MSTQRYALTLSYRGTRYHGWQTQPAQASYKRGPIPEEGKGIPTIQETLQNAIGRVVGHPVSAVGSSRTDTGVHAKGQLVHFDTASVQIPPENIRRATNHILPEDIMVRSLVPVADSFNAIRSTVSKRYQYYIYHTSDRSPFTFDLAWHRWQKMDVEAMKEAAGYFVGTQDFASFARPGHARENTIRTVLSCSVSYRAPTLVISVEGTGFLWNMVRIMVGTLVEVGLGKHLPEAIREMLAAKDRRVAGATAPPHGLYLQWVKTK